MMPPSRPPTVPPTAISNGVFIAALAGAQVPLTSAWVTFLAAAATWLSIKVLTE